LRKILIFGNSGSGKSTLAKKIATAENLSHLDMDELAWLATDPPERAPLPESKGNIERFTNSHQSWVIEGCYTDLLEIVSPLANEIIYLNISMTECVFNAQNRPWEPHKYASKQDQDNNLDMLINWICQYTEREDVFSFQSHKKFYENFNGIKSMRTSNET
jgi:adenylate kinase family enzyme